MVDEEDVENEDAEDKEVVLPACANISSSSCLGHGTRAKISLFSSKPIFIKESNFFFKNLEL